MAFGLDKPARPVFCHTHLERRKWEMEVEYNSITLPVRVIMESFQP